MKLNRLFVSLSAVVATALAFGCGPATAQTTIPQVYKNKTSVAKAYGTLGVIAFSKTTTSGNRVKLEYGNGNEKYLEDTAGWNTYTDMVTECLNKTCQVVDNDPSGYVVTVVESNGIECVSGVSTVNFDNRANALQFSDSCVFANKVLGKAK